MHYLGVSGEAGVHLPWSEAPAGSWGLRGDCVGGGFFLARTHVEFSIDLEEDEDERMIHLID